MKKKLLTLLTLLLCAVGGAKAATETIGFLDGRVSNDEVVGTSVTIAGSTYDAGNGSNQYGSMTTKGIKLRAQRGSLTIDETEYYALVINVKENYVVNSFKFTGYSNDKSTTVVVKGLYVDDGTTNLLTKDYTLPVSGDKTAVTIDAVSMTASSKITLAIDKASYSQYIAEMVIGYTYNDPLTPVSLSFPNASYNTNLGGTFTAPTLTVDPIAATSEVVYTSSNTAVATVAADGSVTIVAAGSTTITAAISGSETYKNASASYVLTVVDPSAIDVSATWTMADGEESVGVAGAAETVMKMDWLMASNIKIHATPTATYGGTTVTQFVPIAKAADTERVSSNYVEFSMTPWKGLTFTPTAVSFEAFKVGTDGPKIDVDFIDGEGNTIKLETNAAITRNNKVGQEGQAAQVHNHTLTTAVASTKAVKLRIYIRNCATDKNVAFGNIVISGTASGEAVELTSYTVTTSLNIVGAGTVSPLLGANSVYETNDLRLTAVANEGYEFVNWTIDGETQTGNPYIIKNITANHTAVANFKQLMAVTFAAGEGTGIVPANIYGDEGATITVPKSYFLAKNGYTLVGWNDGTKTYKTGETFEMPATNVILTAVFEENTESLSRSLASTTVLWDFQQKNIGLFTSASSGTFVAQANINEKTVDVPMTFNKQIPNASWTDWANIGNKPTLTIPAVKGMQITLLTYTSPSATTIAGATDYDVTGSSAPYTVEYTYTGSDETVDIVMNDGSYIRSVSVTYPKTMTFIDVTEAGYRTFASSSALDFTGTIEGLTAYRAVVSGEDVTFEVINTEVPADEGMLIKAAEGRYYVPLAAGTPAAIDNAFVGVTASTEVNEPIFILYKDETHPIGFYKTTAASFTVSANTAYLPESVSAHSFIGFEEGETTGIKNLTPALSEGEGVVYNLQGRRVAQPQKGLYIVNGKKVIVK